MLSDFLALIGAIPGIGNIVTSLTTALFNAKVSIVRAQIGGDVEKAKQIVTAANVAQHERTASLGVIAGSRVLTWLLVAFASPLAVYEWKAVVYDKIACVWLYGATCSTDPLGSGDIGQWASTIIWCLFGSGTAVSVSQMWFSRKQ